MITMARILGTNKSKIGAYIGTNNSPRQRASPRQRSSPIFQSRSRFDRSSASELRSRSYSTKNAVNMYINIIKNKKRIRPISHFKVEISKP